MPREAGGSRRDVGGPRGSFDFSQPYLDFRSLSSPAVGTHFRRAIALATRDAMGDQASDGGAAGMIPAQHLAQEDPWRHLW
jgi:hypothetical protein